MTINLNEIIKQVVNEGDNTPLDTENFSKQCMIKVVEVLVGKVEIKDDLLIIDGKI